MYFSPSLRGALHNILFDIVVSNSFYSMKLFPDMLWYWKKCFVLASVDVSSRRMSTESKRGRSIKTSIWNRMQDSQSGSSGGSKL